MGSKKIFCYLSGYENYNLMRVDPLLCFLSRLGMPNHVMERTSADTTDPDMEAAERLDTMQYRT